MGKAIQVGAEVRWHTYGIGWRFGVVVALLRGHFGPDCDGLMIETREGTVTRSVIGVELCGVWPG